MLLISTKQAVELLSLEAWKVFSLEESYYIAVLILRLLQIQAILHKNFSYENFI